MPMDKWDECGGAVNEYELEGRACYAGLDLSSTSDLTAMVLVFPPRDRTMFLQSSFCYTRAILSDRLSL